MRAIEVDIIDINEIMRDLSAMVTAQGEVIGKLLGDYRSTPGFVNGRDEIA